MLAEPPLADQPLGYGPSGIAAVESHRDAIVLKLTGDLDAVKARQVAQVIDAILDRRPRTLILDLSTVTFVASAGTHLLVDAHQQTGAAIRLQIVATDDARVSRTVPTDSTGAITFHSTLDDALATD